MQAPLWLILANGEGGSADIIVHNGRLHCNKLFWGETLNHTLIEHGVHHLYKSGGP